MTKEELQKILLETHEEGQVKGYNLAIDQIIETLKTLKTNFNKLVDEKK